MPIKGRRILDRRILRLTGHFGEWFVDLKAGYQLDGAHGFGEDTKGDVRRTMTSVKPCSCKECSALLSTGRDE